VAKGLVASDFSSLVYLWLPNKSFWILENRLRASSVTVESGLEALHSIKGGVGWHYFLGSDFLSGPLSLEAKVLLEGALLLLSWEPGGAFRDGLFGVVSLFHIALELQGNIKPVPVEGQQFLGVARSRPLTTSCGMAYLEFVITLQRPSLYPASCKGAI